MANQISKNKRRVTFALDKKLIAQLDVEADKLHLTRTDVIVRACREHLNLDPVPASASQLDEIKNAMVQLVQEQKSGQQEMLAKIEQVPALESAEEKSKLKRVMEVLRS